MKSHSFSIEPLEARIAPAFAAVFELSSLDGLNGFKISGAAAFDYSGVSVSTAGDVNGDGFDDLLIGAYGADPNGALSGASHVLFGRGIEINVSDAIANEGDNGTTALQFTVTLSEAGIVRLSVWRAQAALGVPSGSSR